MRGLPTRRRRLATLTDADRPRPSELTNLFERVGTLREQLHRIRESRPVARGGPCPGRRGQRPTDRLGWGEDDRVGAEGTMWGDSGGTHDHPSIERKKPQAQQPRMNDGADDRLAADLAPAPPASEPDGAVPPLC
jgi:hypothetical protein